MLKMVAVGVTALFVTGSQLAFAQAPSGGARDHLNPAEFGTLSDARINLVKAALQLTPDQEKYWPAIEDAIRSRAKNRQARFTNVVARVEELRERGPIEALRERNPIEFMQRRADALSQRASDLKKLADAWQPLYQTLSTEQRRRLAFLAIYVVRDMRNAMEQHRMMLEDDEED